MGANFRTATLRRRVRKEGEVKFYDYGNICCTMYSYNHKPSFLTCTIYISAFLNLGFTELFGASLSIDFRSSLNLDRRGGDTTSFSLIFK